MTLDALRKLIATGEGETLEFKATTGQREDACETLCGYLNRDGGTVIFGVTRKGELTGRLVSDKTKRELFEVFAKFEPSADIAVDWVDVESGSNLDQIWIKIWIMLIQIRSRLIQMWTEISRAGCCPRYVGTRSFPASCLLSN